MGDESEPISGKMWRHLLKAKEILTVNAKIEFHDHRW